ncbi:Sphingosine-1-phosphate lyase-like protein [Leptotrombidium deliense]|uniref:sphinganine-1-phosphate aldolase n=1 Tax=Leptotrombidium deliense TaxID=299467 RepID=A0A443S9U8_9ACAR|nr:Sphingosine-1-phosphate lyase-like protein [Leptotrombidium deliense]
MDSMLNTIEALFTTGEPFVNRFLQALNGYRIYINTKCSNLEPIQLIFATVAIMWLLRKVKLRMTPNLNESRRALINRKLFQMLMKVPFIGHYIHNEIQKTKEAVEKELMSPFKNEKFYVEVPRNGYSVDEVVEEVKRYQNLSRIKWQEGRVSGAVYANCHNDDLNNLMSTVYSITAYTNPLHADIFPGIRKMEAEVVRMTLSLFNAPEDACGSVTAGGTESILLMCKAYRDYARYVRGIQNPEMVVPVTAHAAFDKAAQMLSMKIKHVAIDNNSMKVNMNAMRKAINGNVCMLVASAPGFPHGIIDPVSEIAELGLKFSIPVHVDCCLGGFLVPFVEKSGFGELYCDFRVDGVTSISADTHKYGFAPKGSSVIMYSDKKYRHFQFSVQTDWPGGVYASPNVGGSRSGATIATCWASLLYHGFDGYVKATKAILTTTNYLKEELSKIEGIFVYGEPKLSVIAVGSNRFNILRLSDDLSTKGWNLNPLQFPPGFHICVTLMHTTPGVANNFIEDVKTLTAEILRNPNVKLKGAAAIYGTAQSIPDRSLVSSLALQYLDSYYTTTFSSD